MSGERAEAEGKPEPGATRVLVDDDTLLDARLAIYHRSERWLAVSDVHFGYEISQQAAGALFPMWGMDTAEARLRALLADYRPARLVIVGDFVHDRAAGAAGARLLATLREICETVLVAGNHDRGAIPAAEMCEFYATDSFCFYHGDKPAPSEAAGRTGVIGHHHPSGTLSDGAGLALKLPALVVAGDRWVLPAFSPWAAGANGSFGPGARRWLCSPKRVLPPRRR